MENNEKIFWILIGFSIFCLLLEAYRIHLCMLDDCCEMHLLFINKEATCPVFTPGTWYV